MIDPRVHELLDLALRWVHVIAGIMWIGNSMLWNWIDRNLEKPTGPDDDAMGRIWLLHSGAFYRMEKTLLAGRGLPATPVHWFKWQAYTTWLSGAMLLAVVYYHAGGAMLVAPGGPLGARSAIIASVAAILLVWPVYNIVWHSPIGRSRIVSGLAGLAAILGLAYALTQIFSGRAAYLHVGAMLATIMAGNVAMIIMPSQRELVAKLGAGESGVPVLAARAKARSIHNNYLTFPVIALMVSSHFPGLYGHPLNWVLLGIIVVAGAGVRHFMNIRFVQPRWRVGLIATVVTALVVLYLVIGRGPANPAPADVGEVSFANARSIIDRRCAACHSSHPSDDVFATAQGGVKFDTPEQIQTLAPRILQRAVRDKTMPFGNKTKMTDEERAMLGRWIESGAVIE